jgi:ribosomal protein L37AE/L43A
MLGGTYPRNRWVFGSFKRKCDTCGVDYLSHELQRQWDGIWACRRCWVPKHVAEKGVKMPVELGDRLY